METDVMPENQLIWLAVRESNQEAIEQLISRHRPRLIRLVVRRGVDREDAEDVLQIALTKVHRSLASFQIEYRKSEIESTDSCNTLERRFSSWLDKIVIRSSIDFAKIQQRHRTVQVEAIDLVCASANSTDSAKYDYEKACDLFAFAKQHLNDKQYAAIYLCYVDGLSAAEISAKMNSSTLAVRALLFRARRALQSAIKRHGFDDE